MKNLLYLFNENLIDSGESCCLNYVKNAIRVLIEKNILKKVRVQEKETKKRFYALKINPEKTLMLGSWIDEFKKYNMHLKHLSYKL